MTKCKYFDLTIEKLQREIEEYKKRVYVSGCIFGGVHKSFVPISVFFFRCCFVKDTICYFFQDLCDSIGWDKGCNVFADLRNETMLFIARNDIS